MITAEIGLFSQSNALIILSYNNNKEFVIHKKFNDKISFKLESEIHEHIAKISNYDNKNNYLCINYDSTLYEDTIKMEYGLINTKDFLRIFRDKFDYNVFWIISKSLIEGMSILHSNNILHGDLKLENVVMFVKDSIIQFKYIDFGRSKIISEKENFNDDLLNLQEILKSLTKNLETKKISKYKEKLSCWNIVLNEFKSSINLQDLSYRFDLIFKEMNSNEYNIRRNLYNNYINNETNYSKFFFFQENINSQERLKFLQRLFENDFYDKCLNYIKNWKKQLKSSFEKKDPSNELDIFCQLFKIEILIHLKKYKNYIQQKFDKHNSEDIISIEHLVKNTRKIIQDINKNELFYIQYLNQIFEYLENLSIKDIDISLENDLKRKYLEKIINSNYFLNLKSHHIEFVNYLKNFSFFN